LASSSPRACWTIYPRALLRVQSLDRGRHDLRKHARALRAAGDENVELPVRKAGIGALSGLQHRRPQRIAGQRRLGEDRVFGARQPEAGRDPVDARGQEFVGASHHRVLLVQYGRIAEQRRGEHRRHRGITAEADDDSRSYAPQQRERRDDAEAERQKRLRF
jgi:hypothetical protein